MKKIEFSIEQKEILNINLTKHSIVTIKALAGTGKTTTVIEVANVNQHLSFLYIARNRSIVDDVKKDIKNKKLKNITSSTMHSVAYQWIIKNRKTIKVIPKFTIEHIADILNIEPSKIKRSKHIYRAKVLFSDFCSQTKDFKNWENGLVETYPEYAMLKDFKITLDAVKTIWESIDTGKTGYITHDYYLKKFIDELPPISEDIIIVDESQDLDEIMYAFIEKQINYGKGIIAVGDQNQSIYGFLKSKDIIAELNKRTNTIQRTLTRSFRFAPNSKMEILANNFLAIKDEKIYGATIYENNNIETVGYIARTNLQVMQKAIDLIKSGLNFNLIGGLDSINIPLIYDIWSLSSELSAHKVKSAFLKGFKSKRELQKWAEDQNDLEYLTACRIVDTIKRWQKDQELRKVIRFNSDDKRSFLTVLLKAIEIKINPRSEIILSTFHRSKGLGMDKVVVLASEEYQDDDNTLPVGLKSENNMLEYDNENYEIVSLDNTVSTYDEYNLMYVAATRAKKHMDILDRKIIVSGNFSMILNGDIGAHKRHLGHLLIKIPYKAASSTMLAIEEDLLPTFIQNIKTRGAY